MQTTGNTVGTRGLLGRLNKDIQRTEREIEERETLLRVLRSARVDISRAIPDRAVTEHSTGTVTRVAALQEILEASETPVTIDQMVKELRKRGVPTNKPGINATLAYAKRKGLAKNVDRGLWSAVTSQAA